MVYAFYCGGSQAEFVSASSSTSYRSRLTPTGRDPVCVVVFQGAAACRTEAGWVRTPIGLLVWLKRRVSVPLMARGVYDVSAPPSGQRLKPLLLSGSRRSHGVAHRPAEGNWEGKSKGIASNSTRRSPTGSDAAIACHRVTLAFQVLRTNSQSSRDPTPFFTRCGVRRRQDRSSHSDCHGRRPRKNHLLKNKSLVTTSSMSDRSPYFRSGSPATIFSTAGWSSASIRRPQA